MPNSIVSKFSWQKVRGVVAIEAAFVLPVLILLIIATIEITYILHARHAMLDAAREGARYAAIETVTAAEVKNKVISYLTTMKIKASSACPNNSCITISPSDPSTVKRGESITVSLTIPAAKLSIVPNNGIYTWGSIKLNVSASMAKEK